MVHDGEVIDRKTDLGLVRSALKRSRVVALLGPRQCGKTTLARQFVPADSINYFDLEFKNGRRIGLECKRADAPRLTPSMHIALADLKLDELHVVYPGAKPYMLADRVQVVPLAQFLNAK